jgi:gamma-glutamyl phosphate reductase
MGTTAEKDTGIDQLINILRVMFSKIVDTNAQNLARTEAKDTIERLQFRLTFSVRSRQKMALDMDSGGSQNVLNWNRQFSTIVSTTS